MMTESSAIRHPQSPVPPAPSRYPFGLRVIIALFILKAIVIITLLTLGIFVRPLLPVEDQRELTVLLDSSVVVVTYFVLAPLQLLAAIGLWRRKRWAWVLTMVLLAYSMTYDIFNFWEGAPNYLSMFLNAIQVGYLNQQEVQNLFQENRENSAI
jgi:hypothetical protein